MSIGNNVFIEKGAHLSCREGLTISDNVLMVLMYQLSVEIMTFH